MTVLYHIRRGRDEDGSNLVFGRTDLVLPLNAASGATAAVPRCRGY